MPEPYNNMGYDTVEGYATGENPDGPDAKRQRKDTSPVSPAAYTENQVEESFNNGWLSEWEKKFYLDIISNEHMTANQQTHREKVESKLERCYAAKNQLEAALQTKKINEWEYKFYIENVGRDNLSDKQQATKATIDQKLAGNAGGTSPRKSTSGQFASSSPARKSTSGQFASSSPALPKTTLLSSKTISAARAANKISEWELNFYNDLGEKDLTNLSEKQENRKMEIEKKVRGEAQAMGAASSDEPELNAVSEAWGGSCWGDIKQAIAAGVINDWEKSFVMNNWVRTAPFSEKQQPIVDRILAKLRNRPGDSTNSGFDSRGAAPTAGGAAPTAGGAGFSTAWSCQLSYITTCFEQKRINQWEKDFAEKHFERQSFTEKMEPIVQKIKNKMGV